MPRIHASPDIVRQSDCVSVRAGSTDNDRPRHVRRLLEKMQMGGRYMKKVLVGFVSIGALLVAGAAYADTKDKKIALSNNYAGNSWRQAMLKSWDKVTKPAVASGIVAAADAYTTSENQVTEQAAQIQNLI